MPEHVDVARLCSDVVGAIFEVSPHIARWAGRHDYDGVLADTGAAALGRHLERMGDLAEAIASVDESKLDLDTRADLGTTRHLVADERFRLAELREPWRDPRWSLAAADCASYVTRAYAPVADRATAMCRQLEALPDYLGEAAAMLDGDLPEGPRGIALDIAAGHAAFLSREARAELGDLGDEGLRRRLDAAVESGAAACERYADAVRARGVLADSGLGAERFTGMLAAQEGVTTDVARLRAIADSELRRLGEEATEVAGRLGFAADPAAAFAEMEREHPTADTLLASAAGMLARLRDFWENTGAVGIDPDVDCTVRPSPAFMSWVSAAYENPGAFDPPGLPHFYFITPVDPAWSASQADEWLRHLNDVSLENVSVHEVYPGHFVHAVHGLRAPGVTRRAFWFSGFGEGWAHYTEQLAIEHGLAEGRPLLHLAQLQDAILRACRFRTAVGMHTEGMTLDDSVRLFTEHAHLPLLAAQREARRGTYDPMYLVYTLGKLEILRWRDAARSAAAWNERRFHDTMIGAGFAPLDVVRLVVEETFAQQT